MISKDNTCYSNSGREGKAVLLAKIGKKVGLVKGKCCYRDGSKEQKNMPIVAA